MLAGLDAWAGSPATARYATSSATDGALSLTSREPRLLWRRGSIIPRGRSAGQVVEMLPTLDVA